MANPFAYIEIPVIDLDRAVTFYSDVFELEFERAMVDGYEMALFPHDPASEGCTGALAKGDVYVPSRSGPLVYMRVASINGVVERAARHGAMVLLERKSIGNLGYVAEISDSEGNRIGLHEPAG